MANDINDIYHIYAPQDESADTEADRAIKDGNGDEIASTYAKSIDIDPIKEKLNTIEEGAQVNDIEHIFVGDVEQEINDKTITLKPYVQRVEYDPEMTIGSLPSLGIFDGGLFQNGMIFCITVTGLVGRINLMTQNAFARYSYTGKIKNMTLSRFFEVAEVTMYATANDLVTKEDKSNKVTSLSEASTDTQYPSAKAVFDITDGILLQVLQHGDDHSNPHRVTKAQVGLGNVDNTSDANKPISTATQNALDLKADKNKTIPLVQVGAFDKLYDFATDNSAYVNKEIALSISHPAGIVFRMTGCISHSSGPHLNPYEFDFAHVDSSYHKTIYGLDGDENLTFYDLVETERINEKTSNKVTTLSSSSTNAEYPSAKAVFDFVSNNQNVIETTWSALKALRDNSQLIHGKFYRITDYVTTTAQLDTSSTGHQFDVIVLALSNNSLSESAYACLHAGDTYFANSKLEAWKLWYCLDNDADRFAWANANGKGVIYRMIDEFNNDVPYDFKNILFTNRGKYANAYTFSYTENSTIKDASLSGLITSCYSNAIKEYVSDNKQQLNFNVFYSADSDLSCYSNTIDNDCYSNTFGAYCFCNSFGKHCSYSSFGNCCFFNSLGNGCEYVTLGQNCNYNKIGNGCAYVSLGDYCTYNMFGDDCCFNVFGTNPTTVINYCRYNVFDNGCSYICFNSSDASASSSNQLQNVHIHLGVKGTSMSNMRTISVNRNLQYDTEIRMAGSTEIILNA